MNLSLKHDFPNPIGIVLLVIYIVKMQSIEMDFPNTIMVFNHLSLQHNFRFMAISIGGSSSPILKLFAFVEVRGGFSRHVGL